MSRHLNDLGYWALDAIQRGHGQHLATELGDTVTETGLATRSGRTWTLTDRGLDALAKAHYDHIWPEGLPEPPGAAPVLHDAREGAA